MYKDVAKRILASILTICMIGSTPGMNLLVAKGGEIVENTHTYAYGSGELKTTNNYIEDDEWIANAYVVESNNDTTKNAQVLQSVAFALDKSAQYGDGARSIKTADYTVEIYTYDAAAEDPANVLTNGTAAVATINGKYKAEDCEDDYFTVLMDDAVDVLLGDGEGFAVKVTLENAYYGEDGSDVLVATDKIYYKSSKDSNAVSYVNGERQDGYAVHVKATTVETSKEIDVKGIRFKENSTMIMTVDEQKTLNVVYMPATTSQKELSWESSDENVATVDEKGTVKAIAPGNARITATSTDDSTIYATISIDVCKDIAGLTYSDIAAQTYQGIPLYPGFEVWDEDKMLSKENGNYTVTYINNTDVGQAIAKVTANGNGYKGEKTVTFQIIPVEMGNGTVTATCDKAYEYTGEAVTLKNPGEELVVTYKNSEGKSIPLLYERDFKIKEYRNNTAAGNQACVVLEGTGNYKGTLDCYFIIKKSDDSDSIQATVNTPSFTYNGSPQKPAVTVKDGTTELVLGRDYKVEYPDDITNAEEKTITITGVGAYATYQEEVSYTINPRQLDKGVEIAELPNQLEGVEAATLKGLRVSYNGTALKNGTDYTVTVEKEDGKVTVTLTGKGNFQGTVKQTVGTGTDIANCTITVEDTTYTGEKLTPKVTIKDKSDADVDESNYTLTWNNNVNAGTATVVVSGKGTYAGETDPIKFTIKPRDLSDVDVTVEYNDSVVYHKPKDAADAIVTEPTLTYKSHKLKKGTDYTVEFSGNDGVTANAKITITGSGNYKGKLEKTYSITAADLHDLDNMTYEVKPAGDHPYTGSQIRPEITVKQNGVELEEGADYKVEYYNNIAIGQGTICVNGLNNYANSQHIIYFQITKVSIADATVSAIDDLKYDGTKKEPALTVTVDGVPLNKGTDYDVTYSNNIEAGQATVTLTGKDNYSGTKSATFKIIKDISNNVDTITVEAIPSQSYAGTEVTPGVVIKDKYQDGRVYTLKEDKDYTLTYKDNDKIGTATVTITGKGYYKGTQVPKFTIGMGDLSAANSGVKVTLANANPNALRFTGSAITPAVKVTCNGNVLTLGTDYTVQYFYNTSVKNNSATKIQIAGKDKFGGTRSVFFDIIPKDISYDSAIDITVEEIDALVLLDKGYPTVTVKDTDRDAVSGEKVTAGGTGGYHLKEGETKDYVLGNVDVDADGQCTVEIIGQNNYAGSIKVPFTVKRTDIEDSAQVTIQSGLPEDQKSFVYTGTEIIPTPVVTVTIDGTAMTLEKDVDYTVSTGAVNVGTGYKYTINFIGKYEGTYTSKDTFDITQKSISESDVTIDEIPNQAYTGQQLTPAVTLRYNGKAVDSSNYTVTYTNNVVSGATATVTIAGQNNFKGTRFTTFKIRPNIEADLTVTGLENAFVYTSKEITPQVTAYSAGKKLAYGIDYTLDYENNIEANEKDGQKPAYVVVKGAGEYGGQKKFPFTIRRKNMLDNDIKVTVEDAIFTGGIIQPKVKITYTLPDGSVYVLRAENADGKIRDYDASVGSTSSVGDEVTVTIKPSGINFYVENDSFTKKFKILPKPLVDNGQNLASDFAISEIEDIQYKSGQAPYEPEIVLQDKARSAEGTSQTSGSTFYKLVKGKDYTIAYANNNKPGTASYTITGLGNYSGTYKGYFTIIASIEDATISIQNQTYTGDPIEPNFTVSFADMVLRKDVDYQYEFSNNINAGQASLTIIGSGNYAGSQKVETFTILPKTISDKDVTMTHVYGSYTYTGSDIHPDPHFTYNKRKLAYGTDFTCSYEDGCSKAGSWFSFTITGIGNFTGTLTKEYKIGDNYTESTVKVNLSDYSFVYTGKPIQPIVSVSPIDNPYTQLRQNIDYQYEYEDNVDVGTAHVNTWGDPIQSEYAGNVSVDFEITPKSVSDEDVVINEVADVTYSGRAAEPTPAVIWNGEELILGEDFEYAYKNNVLAGIATVTIEGIGNFTGTKSVEFTIKRKDISEAASGISVEDIADQIYTGNAVEPKPEVLWEGKALDSREDYTLAYENNIKLGEATVMIQGIGNYIGTIRKTFHITRVPMERMEVEYQREWKYTGNPIEPPVKISYEDNAGNRIQVNSSEFTITYKNAIDSGEGEEETGIITITGNGNYEGTKSCYYTIEPRDLGDATITVDRIPNQVLDAENKAEPKPVLTFRPDSKTTYTLIEGVDYELSYSDNTEVGKNGKVTIKGLHNFVGTTSKEFYIGRELNQYIDSIEFVETPNYIYNGKAQIPEIKVNLNEAGSVDLVEGRDYEILYDGQYIENITDDAYATKAGIHKISVNGLEPYGGEFELTYEIKKRDISEVRFDIEDQTYTGSEIHPFIVGTDVPANTRLGEDESTATITEDISKDDMLINKNAFTTYYEGNCTNIGTVTVVIKATEQSNYTGSATVQFNISAKSLESESISSSTVTRQDYTGSEVKPGVTITDSKRNAKGEVYDPTVDSEYYTLVEGIDYDITYSDNIYPCIVIMTITGKNYYTGTLTKRFEIVADLANAVIAPIQVQQYKNGEPLKPKLTVTLGKRTLKENFDYTVSYSNNTSRGTATAIIAPVAGSMFIGSNSITFEISRDLTDEKVTLNMIDSNFTYTGLAITPKVSVTIGSAERLTEGQDYTVSYENNVNVGTATVKVTGKGTFQGTLTGTFEIIKRSIIRCNFDNVVTKKYTQTATSQNLIVTDGTKRLVKNQDYTVAYVNNTNPGIATMTISGIGNYAGIKTIRYLINVPDMTTVTAEATSKSVKLSWSAVPGAGGYAIYDADNKLIAKTASTSYTHKKLKSMMTYEYKVRPYVVSDGATYYGGFYKTISVVTTPTKPSIKVKAKTRQIKISWKKIKQVSGYEIYRSKKKSGKYKKIKTIKKDSRTSYTNKNLKSNKKYYYKVRAYKTVNGKKVYSSYSSVRSAKTK